MATPLPGSYQAAVKAARAREGALQLQAARQIEAAIRAFADQLAAAVAKLPAGETGALASVKILRRVADQLEQRINLTIGNARVASFQDIQGMWQDATVQIAKLRNMPAALMGQVRNPPISLLGAYSNINAAAHWRTLIQRYVSSASAEADNIVRQALLQGVSPVELARRLRPYVQGAEPFHKAFGDLEGVNLAQLRAVDPDAAATLRYNSYRIAVSETHNARHEAEVQSFITDPYISAVQWTVSPQHDRDDDCDALAQNDFYGLGPGIYPVDQAPITPHPFCQCELMPVTQDTPAPKPDATRTLDTGDIVVASDLTKDRADRLRNRLNDIVSLSSDQAVLSQLADAVGAFKPIEALDTAVNEFASSVELSIQEAEQALLRDLEIPLTVTGTSDGAALMANRVNQGLRDVQAAGFDLAPVKGSPLNVTVSASESPNTASFMKGPGGVAPSLNFSTVAEATDLKSYQDFLTEQKNTGWWASDHLNSTVHHETGHYLHWQALVRDGGINPAFTRWESFQTWGGASDYLGRGTLDAAFKEADARLFQAWGGGETTRLDLMQGIARKVSRYAATDPREFISETFAGLMNKVQYSDDVLNLYRELHGPIAPAWADTFAAAEKRLAGTPVEQLQSWGQSIVKTLPKKPAVGAAAPAVTTVPQRAPVFSMAKQAAEADHHVRLTTTRVTDTSPPVKAAVDAGGNYAVQALDRVKAYGIDLPAKNLSRIELAHLPKAPFEAGMEFTAGSVKGTIKFNLRGLIQQGVKGFELDTLKQQGMGWWASGAADQAFVHELGHFLHLQQTSWRWVAKDYLSWSDKVITEMQSSLMRAHLPSLWKSAKPLQDIAREVSRYATTNPLEFIAETFTGLLHGATYSDPVLLMYKALNGPEIPKLAEQFRAAEERAQVKLQSTKDVSAADAAASPAKAPVAEAAHVPPPPEAPPPTADVPKPPVPVPAPVPPGLPEAPGEAAQWAAHLPAYKPERDVIRAGIRSGIAPVDIIREVLRRNPQSRVSMSTVRSVIRELKQLGVLTQAQATSVEHSFVNTMAAEKATVFSQMKKAYPPITELVPTDVAKNIRKDLRKFFKDGHTDAEVVAKLRAKYGYAVNKLTQEDIAWRREQMGYGANGAKKAAGAANSADTPPLEGPRARRSLSGLQTDFHPPQELKDVLSSYQGSSRALNLGLRYNNLPAHLESGVQKLDRLMAEVPRLKQDILVYRGFSSGAFPHQVTDRMIGTIIKDAGFLSTSVSQRRASAFGRSVLLRIRVPRGAAGAYVPVILRDMYSHLHSEQEFLLPRNTRLRITNIIRDDPRVEAPILIDAEVIL